jgi:RNA polymerase sigma-70 factor (ECF subfamily)
VDSSSGLGSPIGDEMARVLAKARTAWPDVFVADEAAARFIEERLEGRPLSEVPVEDLYLACACAHGVSAAIAAFEHELIRPLEPSLHRTAGSVDAAAEVQQRLRVQMLVESEGKPPQITGYRGHGRLKGWLRVVATREAVRVARERDRHEDDQLASDVAATANTELEYFRRVYNQELLTALRKALASLESREQNVLRHHYIDRIGIDEIARIHHIHRATAARWLESAKARLVRRARRTLEAQLGSGACGLESIVRLLRSRLDLSLRRIFSR